MASVSSSSSPGEIKSNIDIYDIHEDLVKTIASMNKLHVSSSAFFRLTENYQRVKKEGNENFSLKSRNYFRALELYNKSICYSLSDSENISIGYANRSAVLFELKNYQQCLENISMARKANFPQRLMHKLDKRENDCKKLLTQAQATDLKSHEFVLSHESHQTVPFISNCLEMGCSKEEGRFIYTKTALNVGDVVAMEDPYCTALLPAMRYIRCAYCTKEACFTLIPCGNCTSAMFCSEDCREKGWREFHKYECPIIDFLLDSCTKIHLTALRTCFVTLSLFSNINECRAFCENSDNIDKNVFDLNYKEISKLEEYRAVHGLVTNEEKRPVNDLFQRATLGATIKNILLEFTPLLNHSCAPNVVRIHKGTTAILFVLRNIEANGKLYDNYGNTNTV
uniref:MYND-type domain-containing protein n=1 Tax=Megaselia scalaris TaxID=36166 RepID=T1GUG9_MEGSC